MARGENNPHLQRYTFLCYAIAFI